MPVKLLRIGFCLLIRVLFAVFFTLQAVSANTEVFVNGEEIFYVGWLTSEANAKVFSLYEEEKVKPTILNITSTGGDIEVGMQLGEWLVEKQMHIKVEDYCFSSCANYIFPAGVNKYLGSKAIFGFHGGAHSETFIDVNHESTINSFPEDQRETVRKTLEEAVRVHFKENRKREVKFYKKIGVSRSISILGQEHQYQRYSGDLYNGWYYSLEDLGKLGVKNVIVLDGLWHPQENAKKYRLFLLLLSEHKGQLLEP